MVKMSGPNGNVQLDLSDGVAEVRFDNPERRNCLSETLFKDLYECFLEIDDRIEEVTSILITHEGPVFCSGLDIDVFAVEEEGEEAAQIREYYDACFGWLEGVDRPVVCAAKGPAIASGIGFVYRSDINVVSPDFEFWLPEIDIDVISLSQGARFIKLFGVHRAASITFLGEAEKLSAQESREIGLVTHIVDADEVDAAGREFAERMAETQDRHGTLLDVYEVFNLAKHEHRTMDPGARSLVEAGENREEWFE